MKRLAETHQANWTQLEALAQHSLCMIGFFKSSLI
jgi:hypothetical protein